MSKENNLTPPSKETVGTGIRLSVEMMRVLDELAEREHRNRNNLIQMLLEEALERRGEL